MFKSKEGFTLLKALLVVVIIAILAGTVILALNPSKKLADSSDTQINSTITDIGFHDTAPLPTRVVPPEPVDKYSPNLLNPSEKLADSRNAQRRTDVNTILNAIYRYAIDNNGNLPASITTTPTGICRTSGTCAGLIDLSVLTAMPTDPSLASSSNTTGYNISKSANNRVTVTAVNAENSATISVTR